MINKKIEEISKKWFYTEPLLFAVLCTHKVIPSSLHSVPARTGNKIIELNADFFSALDDLDFEKYLTCEVYRIALEHPYKRQIHNASKEILYLASDAVLMQVYPEAKNLNLPGVEYLKNLFGSNITFPDLTFDEWYKKIYEIISSKGKGGSFAGTSVKADFGENSNAFLEAAEYWEENDEVLAQIQNQLKRINIQEGFGKEGAALKRELLSECDFSFDYRKALTQFRAGIVSEHRHLTRMRPSRRYGFNAMGSRYENKASLLIGVDSSGSISDECFSKFCHAIKKFFFLGIIEKIDVVFFDTKLKNRTPVSFRKKINFNDVKGKGGTNFNPVIEFFSENKKNYDGLIIFTDGEGPIPKINSRLNILWILDGRISYEKNSKWISKISGSRATYLP